MPSLFAPVSTPVTPIQTRIRGEVQMIKNAPRNLSNQLIKQWENSFDFLWKTSGDITPAQRIAELGTDAAELFEASSALVTFLVTMLTGKDDATVARVMAKVATIPPFTAHQDGTVTLN